MSKNKLMLVAMLCAIVLTSGCAASLWGFNDDEQATATPTANVLSERSAPTPTPNIKQTVEAQVEATMAAQATDNISSEAANEQARAASGGGEQPTPAAPANPTPKPVTPTTAPSPVPTEVKITVASSSGSSVEVTTFTGGGYHDLANITEQAPCPTDGEMQRMFGFDTINLKPVNTSVMSEGEVCKWTLQAAHNFTFQNIPFLPGWIFTITQPDETVIVFYGDGQRRSANGITFRFVPAYAPDHWVRSHERLIAHEFNFGWGQGRNPRYLTLNGNLNAPQWNNYQANVCPQNVVQVAGLVGGEPQFWTRPDWSGGAWMYEVPRNQAGDPSVFHILTASQVPGTRAWVDYWNGQTRQPDRLTNWQTLALADASYHCHPANGSDGYVPDGNEPPVYEGNMVPTGSQVTVPVNNQVSTAQVQNVQPAQQAAQQPAQQAEAPAMRQCYATAADVAAAVGGQASNWKAPDWDGGAWVFHSNTPVKLRIPSAGGKIDHHALGTITSGETRDAVQDASYTCIK